MKQRDPLLHMHFIYAEVQPVAAIKIFFCKSSRKHSEIAAKNSKRLQSLSHGIRCRGDMEGHCTTGRNRQCGIPVETHMHAAGTVGGSVDIAILPAGKAVWYVTVRVRTELLMAMKARPLDRRRSCCRRHPANRRAARRLRHYASRPYRARQASVRCSSSRSL